MSSEGLMWCHECQQCIPGECKKHGRLHVITDSTIPSRSRLTLPAGLAIRPICKTGQEQKPVYGVFAKRVVPCRTQFGPVEAPVRCREAAHSLDGGALYEQGSAGTVQTSANSVMVANAFPNQELTNQTDATHCVQRILTPNNGHLNIAQGIPVSIQDCGQAMPISIPEGFAQHLNPQLAISIVQGTGVTHVTADGRDVITSEGQGECAVLTEGNANMVAMVTQNAVAAEDVGVQGSLPEQNETETSSVDWAYELKVFDEEGNADVLDLSDEDRCNWMMYVRPAETLAEQNLVAYQYLGKIYFTSVKPIPSSTELRVWFSSDYAQQLKKGILTEEEQEQSDTGSRWVCSVCQEIFASFPELEGHVCQKSTAAAVVAVGRRHSGRRKGRPRKYIKPTRGWRARLEKTKLKESLSQQKKVPGRRGRPPKVKVEVINTEEEVTDELEPEIDNSTGDISIEDGGAEEGEIKLKIKRIKREKKKRGPKPKKDPLPCPYCAEQFSSEAAFMIHVSIHTGTKPYICPHPTCEKGFMSKFKLERHRLIHTCPRHHRCPYCDKSFNRKDHLKNHLITHDPNKKIWKCEICGKEYSYNFSFRTHMAFHAAESGATTECGICRKVFEGKEELLTHLKIHSGARSVKNSTEKTHLCMECGKKFYTRKDVKRHMITHTKKKDFLCQYCPQRFGRKDHLTRHLRTSHTTDGSSAKPYRPRKEHREKTTVYENIRIPLSQVEMPVPVLRDVSPPPSTLLVTTQPISNIYSSTSPVQNIREVPLQTIYDSANTQPVITMANIAQGNQLVANVHNVSSAPTQYTVNDRYIPALRQGMEVQAQADYRTIQNNISPASMYLNPTHHTTQQPPPMVHKDAAPNMDLSRANGILQGEYQPIRDQGGRPSVLCGNDPRQNPASQTFSTLLGYMETLRFLENLPTNNPAAVLNQMEQSQGHPNMLPVNSTAYSVNTGSLVHPPSQIAHKSMAITHQNAYQPGS